MIVQMLSGQLRPSDARYQRNRPLTERLSEATEERFQELGAQIAGEHAFDEVLKERLHRLLVERARAYLRSDENMTEDDAYILVREDLRDARLGKRILLSLRCEHAPIGVARRVAAVIVASTLAYAVMTVLGFVVGTGVFVALAAGLRGGAAEIAHLATYGLTVVGGPVLQVLLLRRWQRRLEGGDRPWFVRWDPRHVLGAVALAVIWCGFWPRVHHVSGATPAFGGMADLGMLWMAIGPVSTIVSCVIWLWWLDQAPRNRWASRTAFPSWALWHFLRYLVMVVTPNFVLYIALAGSPIEEHEFQTVLAGGTLPGGTFAWSLALLTQPWMPVLLSGIRFAVGTTLFPGLVAWGIYAAVRHVRRRGMPQEELDFPWVR